MVSAGGTLEAIDPVRFIGNRSSGRQGLAIAYEALRLGADVTVVAGQTDYFDLPGARVISVESAEQMQKAISLEFPQHDALIMSAAVADAKPASKSDSKIKKESLETIVLEKNPDILAAAGKTKRGDQVLVGFAAETAVNYLDLGQEKLSRKGADLLYVNNVKDGAVFGERITSGALLSSEGVLEIFDGADKYLVARSIMRQVAKRLEFVNG